jgi:hypothetical protein
VTRKDLTARTWFYPAVCGLLIVISMLPPITRVPYDPRSTQDVIVNILMVSILPYQSWGWVFHVATLAVVALAVFRLQVAGRVMAAYFGLNYLLIAALRTNAVTDPCWNETRNREKPDPDLEENAQIAEQAVLFIRR